MHCQNFMAGILMYTRRILLHRPRRVRMSMVCSTSRLEYTSPPARYPLTQLRSRFSLELNNCPIAQSPWFVADFPRWSPGCPVARAVHEQQQCCQCRPVADPWFCSPGASPRSLASCICPTPGNFKLYSQRAARTRGTRPSLEPQETLAGGR